MYCDRCNRLVYKEKCPGCGRRDLRLPGPEDFCFLTEPQVRHFHHTFLRDLSFTVSGVSGRFRSDHSSASCGYSVAKSLNPFSNIYPLQYGHLLPSDRVEMRVSHSLPHSLHFHQALRLAKTVTCVGSRGAFLADHSAASSGF